MADKIYIIRKYVVAKDIKEALKKEAKVVPHDCWLEETSTKQLCENILLKNNKKK